MVTFETSHLEISPSNDSASLNNAFMSVTADTSHDPIGPFGPAAQLPTAEIFKHSPTAALSCALVVVVVVVVVVVLVVVASGVRECVVTTFKCL